MAALARLRPLLSALLALGVSSTTENSAAAASGTRGCASDDAPASGCFPFDDPVAGAWLLRASRPMNLSALPHGARPMLCYDGHAKASDHVWHAPRFAETALVLIDDFLTSKEVEQIAATCKETACPLELGASAVADGAITERIASLVSMPIAPGTDETPLLMTFEVNNNRPGADATTSVHHDKNNMIRRHLTVIIYLTTVIAGGETAFPGLAWSADRRHWASARPREIEEVALAFDQMVQEKVTARLHGLPTQPGEVALPLPRERVCPADWTVLGGGADAPPIQPLAVRPIAGRALLFWHETADGSEALADVYHDGCPVIEGTKRTVVLFKSYAPDDPRCHTSPYCRLHYAL